MREARNNHRRGDAGKGPTAGADDEPAPRPTKPVARDTHELELRQLAIQGQIDPEYDPLAVQAFLWLGRASAAAIQWHIAELRPLNLSHSGFHVLMALTTTPAGQLEPRQLAEQLLVSRPSITGLLDTLESKSLVRRRPHKDDRRRVIVSLTPAGRRLVRRHLPTHHRSQSELFANLDGTQLAQLVVLLRQVRGAVPPHLQPEP